MSHAFQTTNSVSHALWTIDGAYLGLSISFLDSFLASF